MKWVCSKFPNLRKEFSGNTVTPRTPSNIGRNNSTHNISHVDDSVNFDHVVEESLNDRLRHSQSNFNQGKFESAKYKMIRYMKDNNMDLTMIFAIIDTNSDKNISLPEFRSKIRAMHIPLDQEESDSIFQHIDVDGSGTIDLNELITEFSDLNTESVILDLVKIINAGKADSSFVFSRFAVKDKKK